jgi:selenocysteine lyase/cysteine desulfurase
MIRSTLPTSHGFQPLATGGKKIFSPMPSPKSSSPFVSQFEFVGTIDTAPPLCVSAALEFRNNICGGEEKIRAYRFDLAEKAEEKVAEILGTKALSVPKGSRVAFANVWLPLRVAAPSEREPHSEDLIREEDIPAVSGFLSQKMIDEYNCFVVILFYKGSWIARFSAEIYLDIDDFIYGAEMIKTLIGRVRNREYKK